MLYLTGIVAVGVPLSIDFVKYRIYSKLGDMVRLPLLWEVADRDPSEFAAQAYPQVPLLIASASLAVLAALVALVVVRRIETRVGTTATRSAAPSTRSLFWLFVVSVTTASLSLAAPSATAERLRFGVSRKPSAMLLRYVLQRVTDVDRDGFGFLSRPADPAPFDSTTHPYSLEVPGNGIDENRIGGDQPLDFEPVSVIEQERFLGEATPPFLLIFLESFRTDLIEDRLQGREITPFLNRLAREGAFSRHAFVHSPYTVGARAQLFGGRLVPYPDQSTLIDDFKERGYFVAYFSGQDDSFGKSEPLLGTGRADVFYDARQDVQRRSTRSAHPASLQVSWKVLNEHVIAFLEGHADERPLFLYVNIVDTHYPYHSAELDDFLGVRPIAERDIGPDRATEVLETYANAAANVDRAVEQVVHAWWRRMGENSAILITADHGQTFYEDGALGHGQSLDEAETGVPLILWGIGGEWPEPIGLADLRGLIRRHLAIEHEGALAPARFVPDPQRPVFQFMARVAEPQLLALRRLAESLHYDFEKDRLTRHTSQGGRQPLGRGSGANRAASLSALERRSFETMIWSWEALQSRDHARRTSR
jgi:hypothetical protein